MSSARRQQREDFETFVAKKNKKLKKSLETLDKTAAKAAVKMSTAAKSLNTMKESFGGRTFDSMIVDDLEGEVNKESLTNFMEKVLGKINYQKESVKKSFIIWKELENLVMKEMIQDIYLQ